jgi:hypothetical protein
VSHSYALPGPFGPAYSAPTVNIQPVIGVIALETAIFIKRPHLVLMVPALNYCNAAPESRGHRGYYFPRFQQSFTSGPRPKVTRKWFLTFSVYLDSYYAISYLVVTSYSL